MLLIEALLARLRVRVERELDAGAVELRVLVQDLLEQGLRLRVLLAALVRQHRSRRGEGTGAP